MVIVSGGDKEYSATGVDPCETQGLPYSSSRLSLLRIDDPGDTQLQYAEPSSGLL